MIAAQQVFCDYLRLTTQLDEWDELNDALALHLSDGQLQLRASTDSLRLWETPSSSGVVRLERLPHIGVVSISASGQSLAQLRSVGAFGRFLLELASRPHKVTRIDVSADMDADAPPVIADALAKGRCGTVALTRKTIAPSAVEYHNSLRPDGRVSGSVYFGDSSAKVRAVVYDKRLERYARADASWDDTPERVRYEIRVANGLPTLKDAYLPAPLFFHHASPSFLVKPADVPAWTPHGEGFEVERPSPPLPAMRLRSRVESSSDLGALCDLAARDGAGGVEFLVSLVRKRYADAEKARAAPGGVKGPPAPSETSCASSTASGVVVPLRG